MTIVLLLTLGVVFLRGFTEAVVVAIPLVAVFLTLNAVIVVVSIAEIAADPQLLANWTGALTANGTSFLDIARPALLAFPLLVLGLSGFETGVSMMPLVAESGRSPAERLASRVRNTRKLLTAAALIMSVYLITTSFITTVLIPAEEFAAGGAANGRALAYLAHEELGGTFGTVYDISSILILWFAGASAMAGLINIVPRYLPAYGMAPEWGRAVRPVVLVYTAISILLTLAFQADVNAQAGAYATGILAMMVSAAVAVTISAARRRQRRAALGFGVLTVILLYALAANVVEHPDGIVISALFIAAIIAVSLASRLTRAFELRVTDVELDARAQQFIRDCARRTIRLVANEPDDGDSTEYLEKRRQILRDHDLTDDQDFIFVEVTVADPSEFATKLDVHGHVVHKKYRVLTLQSATVPNALAALLLHVRDADQVDSRTSTSNGPKGTRSSTCSASCASVSVRSHRSPEKCSDEPNPTAPADRTSMSADPEIHPSVGRSARSVRVMEPMILRWVGSSGVTVHALADLPELRQQDNGFVWLDVPEWNDGAERLLTEEFGFHHVAVQAARERNHTPRLHVYPDHVFLVIHAPEIGEHGHVHYLELDQFIGREYPGHGARSGQSGGSARRGHAGDPPDRHADGGGKAAAIVTVRPDVRARVGDRAAGVRPRRRTRPSGRAAGAAGDGGLRPGRSTRVPDRAVHRPARAAHRPHDGLAERRDLRAGHHARPAVSHRRKASC